MTSNPFMACIIIPCYNHGSTMAAVLSTISVYEIPCIIVDDGSDADTAQILEDLTKQYPAVHLVRHSHNMGKGAAVLNGMRTAQQLNFTHALQVDADGQHTLCDIPKLITEARAYPECIISGRPIYDHSVPKSRLYSRYITHVWVWIETLSFSIKDSMCGFRVYPLAASLALAETVTLGARMDFDTEVMVRLYWRGVDTRFIPTKVIYPIDGISHFDVLKDNVRISWMHTRLFLLMLPKIPQLIRRNLNTQQPLPQTTTNDHDHWSKIPERTGAPGMWGMRLMIYSYRLLGRTTFNGLLYPVIGYYWLLNRHQRKISTAYLSRLKTYAMTLPRSLPWQSCANRLNSFRHFMRFGEAMLDKIASWRGDIHLDDITIPERHQLIEHIDSKKGTLLIGSHLGDFEVCRALGKLSFDIKINALVFNKHALRFNQIMKELNPKSSINLIQVDELGVDTAILLKQKIDAGEWVAIVGDRTSVSSQQRIANKGDAASRVIWSRFLGEPAPFPEGPFILASLLKCPVFLMFCLKPASGFVAVSETPPRSPFEIHFEPFADPLLLPRIHRQAALQKVVDLYAARLEYYCLRSPLDWFNFYDFWKLTPPK